MKSYHNTTTLEDNQLDLFREYEEIAEGQEKEVMEFMRAYPDAWFTPENVHEIVYVDNGRKEPLTSIRRAMSNLGRKGFLIKSKYADGIGNYGRPVHTWRAK